MLAIIQSMIRFYDGEGQARKMAPDPGPLGSELLRLVVLSDGKLLEDGYTGAVPTKNNSSDVNADPGTIDVQDVKLGDDSRLVTRRYPDETRDIEIHGRIQ